MILKINKFIIIIIVVILIAILIINIKLVEDNESSGILNPSQEGNGVNEKKSNEKSLNPNWQIIGKGNLSTEEIGGRYYLYSSPIYYNNLLGFESNMPSKYVYEINVVDNQLTSNKKKVEEFRVDITENYSIDLMKSDGQIFCETESYRLSDGRLLLGSVYGEMKDKNVWIVDSEGNAEPLLNMGGYEELSKYVFERRKGLLIWIEPLAVLNDDSVLFYSNKNNARDDFFSNSVYIVDKDKNERIIFDASKYNQDILFVGAEKNIVGFTNNSESLLVYDIANEQIKEIPFKERFPESLSPDGHTILFREKDSVEFYLYDILTNGITYIGMPQGYGYNYIGTWSKSGDKFAFLMNGKEGNDPSKNYTTNVKVAIIDVNDGQLYIYDRPSENSYIYPVGSLSWINNNYVVIYTDDNNSWSLKVE